MGACSRCVVVVGQACIHRTQSQPAPSKRPIRCVRCGSRESLGQLETAASWPKSLSQEEEASGEQPGPWGRACLYLDCLSEKRKGYGMGVMSHFLSAHTHTHTRARTHTRRQRCIFPFQIELQRPDWIFLLCIKDRRAHSLPLPPSLASFCFHPSTA